MDVKSVKNRRQLKGMDMKARIEHELKGKDCLSMKELNLDSCRDLKIENLGDNYQNLESLSLINVGLSTLRGFPKLACLKKLELSDNRLSDGMDYLATCPQLTHLNLSGNRIKEVADLAPLANLTSLTNLDLFNCEVTKLEGYRGLVFKLLPKLKYLDGFNAEGENEEEDDECLESEDEDIDEDDSEEDEEESGDDDDDDDDDEEEDANDVGLSYLAKSNLNDEDEEDDGDFDEAKALKNSSDEDAEMKE
jgi:hypothetical protein